MALFNFGKSWFGIVFNPVGYMAQRTTPAEAARKFITANPTSNTITAADTALSFKEDSANWISGCANKLKSDDAGKSMANCVSACQGVFDSDSNVIQVRNSLVAIAEKEKFDVQMQLKENGKNILVYIGAFLFIGLIVYLLTSKK